MNVAELIAELSKLPPDLLVVHSTGTMQDREEVRDVQHGESEQTAWTTNLDRLSDGQWIEIV